MRKINDGGRAYPGQWVDYQPGTGEQVVREQYFGMTLRQWYAGQALAGLCAAHANPGAIVYPDNRDTALKALSMADALIEREQMEAN